MRRNAFAAWDALSSASKSQSLRARMAHQLMVASVTVKRARDEAPLTRRQIGSQLDAVACCLSVLGEMALRTTDDGVDELVAALDAFLPRSIDVMLFCVVGDGIREISVIESLIGLASELCAVRREVPRLSEVRYIESLSDLRDSVHSCAERVANEPEASGYDEDEWCDTAVFLTEEVTGVFVSGEIDLTDRRTHRGAELERARSEAA